MKREAIVVGGGISGLLTTLALAKKGNKVTLIEKDAFLGGNARSYTVDGFKVDTGPHAITSVTSGPLSRLMRLYADGFPEMIDHGHYFLRTKNGLFEMPTSLHKWASFNAITRRDMLVFSRLMIRLIKDNASGKDIMPSAYDYIKGCKLSPKAIRLLDTICYFLSGASMKKTPASRIFSGFGIEGIKGINIKDSISVLKRLIVSKSTSEGQFYPKGGIQSITDRIIAHLPNDVDIVTGAMVEKIIVEDGICKGVETKEKRYDSDMVVYTGFSRDMPSLVTEDLPLGYSSKLKGVKTSRSYTLWMGLNEKIETINYKGSEIWYETDEPYWAMPTSNLDPDLAPKGKQLVAFSFIIKDSIKKTKKDARDTINKVFPGIFDKCEMIHEQITIPEKAAITTDNFFCGNSTPFKGLYVAGTDTDPRSMGLTRAAYSVESLIEILDKDKKPYPN